jgi:hypothetical protein
MMILTVLRVVFGFGTAFVFFGVTETVNVQVPLAMAFTVRFPETEHFFFDDEATLTKTFAPVGIFTPFFLTAAVTEIVRPFVTFG